MTINFIKLRKEHLEKVRTWRNSPHISKFMYTSQNISPGDQDQWFARINKDKSKKYWLINVDDLNVGVVCITDINHKDKRCSWAYYIGDQSARGKGIGKQTELNILRYVFDVMGFNKLCAEVLDFNRKVVEIHQYLGSKIEGKCREHVYKDNKYYDAIIMGVLRSEWPKIKKKHKIIQANIEE